MSTFIWVTQRNTMDKIYVVPEDDSIKGRGWYPQRMSLNAFWRKHHFTFKGHMQFNASLIDAVGWCRGDEVSVVKCESVWDFYDKVHYDYKKQKFYSL